MHVILIMIRYSNCGGCVCIAAIWHFFFLFFSNMLSHEMLVKSSIKLFAKKEYFCDTKKILLFFNEKF